MKNFMHNHFIWIIILALLLIWILYIILGNISIQVTNYSIQNPTIPAAFNGFKIAQVSDLHNAEFGKNNHRLIQKIKDQNPDIIVITGDLIDSRKTRTDIAISFAQQAAQIAPTYYITGNHESRFDDLTEYYNQLTAAGITVLMDDMVYIDKSNSTIRLLGILDPEYREESAGLGTRNAITKLVCDQPECYTILLSHKPELLQSYASCDMDLILSGHVHGGQFRLPWIGGIFAPGQGFFPYYDAGIYTSQSSTMIISRGLGNSVFPFRIGNTPELVIITLKSAECNQ